MNELTKEEIEYLLKRVTFTYKNCTMPDMKKKTAAIIGKLEKMKEKANGSN